MYRYDRLLVSKQQTTAVDVYVLPLAGRTTTASHATRWADASLFIGTVVPMRYFA